MAGELNFEAALKERVALLAGVTLAQIETLLARITPTPGARALVATMRAHGAYAALVSGGVSRIVLDVHTQEGRVPRGGAVVDRDAGLRSRVRVELRHRIVGDGGIDIANGAAGTGNADVA